MNEPIVLGRNRSTGRWEILAHPDQTFSEANRIFEGINPNVDENYNRVIIGRISHSRPTKSPVTQAEADRALEIATQRTESVQKIVHAAHERQQKIDEKDAKQQTLDHAARLGQHNELIDKVRAATGQKLVKKTAPPPPAKKNGKGKGAKEAKAEGEGSGEAAGEATGQAEASVE